METIDGRKRQIGRKKRRKTMLRFKVIKEKISIREQEKKLSEKS